MDKFEDEMNEVRTGNEPGQPGGANDEPEKPSVKRSKEWEENTIRDSKTAKERGKNGGVKSGEVRRARRTAREAAQKLLAMSAKGKMRDNLIELGYKANDEEGITNIDVIVARLLVLAASGNQDATDRLLRIAGYDAEENRKERESINADRRRELELDAKVAALTNGNAGGMALNMGDEDGNNDVVIYMPEVMTEEACEMPPETEADVAE